MPTKATVNPTKLKPHPRNYRRHNGVQLDHIKASIEEHGIYRNVVIAKDNTILAGHGVVLAAIELEMKSLPVVKMDIDPDSPQALKILAGDNEIARLAMNDDRELVRLLTEIQNDDLADLLGTGYDEAMLAALAMVARPPDEIADFDEMSEWVGMPEYGGIDLQLKIVVNCDTQEDKDAFAKKLGITLPPNKVVSMWWPPREDDDVVNVKFKRADA